jgi:hypothetical protein
MSTGRLAHHVHVVWRSERIIAELRLKRLLGNLGLQGLAMLVLAFALLSFEIAAYFLLVQVWSATASAALLGVCNLLVALLLLLLANRRPASQELTLAREVHKDALAALVAEIDQAESVAPATLRSALESTVVPLLLPLIPLVIQRLRRHRSQDAEAQTP